MVSLFPLDYHFLSYLSDNEPPVFQNCPQQPIVVQKGRNGLEPVTFTEPVAVDNSGSIARLEVKPQSFRTPITTFRDMAIKYVAFDYDGNVAICEINITVPGICVFLLNLCRQSSLTDLRRWAKVLHSSIFKRKYFRQLWKTPAEHTSGSRMISFDARELSDILYVLN